MPPDTHADTCVLQLDLLLTGQVRTTPGSDFTHLLSRAANTQLCKHTNTQLHKHTNTQLHSHGRNGAMQLFPSIHPCYASRLHTDTHHLSIHVILPDCIQTHSLSVLEPHTDAPHIYLITLSHTQLFKHTTAHMAGHI